MQKAVAYASQDGLAVVIDNFIKIQYTQRTRPATRRSRLLKKPVHTSKHCAHIMGADSLKSPAAIAAFWDSYIKKIGGALCLYIQFSHTATKEKVPLMRKPARKLVKVLVESE